LLTDGSAVRVSNSRESSFENRVLVIRSRSCGERGAVMVCWIENHSTRRLGLSVCVISGSIMSWIMNGSNCVARFGYVSQKSFLNLHSSRFLIYFHADEVERDIFMAFAQKWVLRTDRWKHNIAYERHVKIMSKSFRQENFNQFIAKILILFMSAILYVKMKCIKCIYIIFMICVRINWWLHQSIMRFFEMSLYFLSNV